MPVFVSCIDFQGLRSFNFDPNSLDDRFIIPLCILYITSSDIFIDNNLYFQSSYSDFFLFWLWTNVWAGWFFEPVQKMHIKRHNFDETNLDNLNPMKLTSAKWHLSEINPKTRLLEIQSFWPILIHSSGIFRCFEILKMQFRFRIWNWPNWIFRTQTDSHTQIHIH